MDLSRNQFGPVGAKAVACVLERHPSLTSVSLSDNMLARGKLSRFGAVWDVLYSLDVSGVHALAAALPRCATLTHLDVSGNILAKTPRVP